MLNLEKRLEVNGKLAALAADRVNLELNGVGRGIFDVRGLEDDAQKALVRFQAGRRGEGRVWPILTGVVAESRALGGGLTRLWVREPSMALDLRADFALRHVTPAKVLAEIEARTGLAFLLPAAGAYLTERLPYFYAEGTCRQALQAMGEAWGLADAIWTSLPDGRLFWGAWTGSPFDTDPVEIPAELIQERDPDARALVLPYMSRLRPGVAIDVQGFRFLVREVVLEGPRATIRWGDVG